MVQTFTIKGRFLMGSSYQIFEREIKADRQEHALEKLYVDLGSKHGTKRKHIIIEDVKAD
ncbi:MAG: 50S ribosomal protein L18a [Candidatus Methanofastidiosa archaeon]|nr:50S ribosomal protein L18a [Candidatus Methanofastidiosa archaeon]